MARQAQFLGLFSNNTLEERVMRIDGNNNDECCGQNGSGSEGATVMIAAGSLAAMFHVTPTMAESRPEAPPPQATATPAGPNAACGDYP